MKRFAFKLQAVLTLRQRNEHAALEKYSRAIRQRQSAALLLTGAEMELSETRRQWLNALADGLPAAHAAQMQAFCHLLEERKQQCEASLHLAEGELNQAGRRMLHARQQREAVETVLARQRERYDRRQRETERRMMDDLVNCRLLPHCGTDCRVPMADGPEIGARPEARGARAEQPGASRLAPLPELETNPAWRET